MKHVFIFRKGDKELFLKMYHSITNLKNEELIEQYNKQAILGIVGVHAQALKLLALRKVFIERFDKSPVLIEDDFSISLTGKIDSGFLNS